MNPMMDGITNLSFDMFFNNETLNCFSDASMRKINKYQLASCAGSVAVCKDTIINEMFRVNSESTVPAAELRGIRNTLSLALMYKDQFRIVNIFSDSQISVLSLREYVYKWRFNPKDGLYYIKSGSPVKNQELLVECWYMLEELRHYCMVNIFHQPGHVGSSIREIKSSIDTFRSSNNIPGMVDYNIARYIASWNNYIDEKSRSIVRRTNVIDNDYIDPIIFYTSRNLFIQT